MWPTALVLFLSASGIYPEADPARTVARLRFWHFRPGRGNSARVRASMTIQAIVRLEHYPEVHTAMGPTVGGAQAAIVSDTGTFWCRVTAFIHADRTGTMLIPTLSVTSANNWFTPILEYRSTRDLIPLSIFL